MNPPMIWDAILHIKRGRQKVAKPAIVFSCFGKVPAAGVSAGAERD